MVDAAAHCFGLLYLITKYTADVDILAELGSTDNRTIVGAVRDVALVSEAFAALLGTAYNAADGGLVFVGGSIVGEGNSSFIGTAGDRTALVVTHQTAKCHHTVDGR